VLYGRVAGVAPTGAGAPNQNDRATLDAARNHLESATAGGLP